MIIHHCMIEFMRGIRLDDHGDRFVGPPGLGDGEA
jgi:hypothetical protein